MGAAKRQRLERADLMALRSQPPPRYSPPTTMKSSRNKYGMGTVTRTKAGNWLATISHQNRRYRKTHPTKDEALDWMDRRQAELTREDRTLTARETRDALDALELLDGHGSLTEATRFFLRHHEGSSVTERTLAEAVQEFLEEKRVAGRREATLRSYGDRLGRLARDQGDGLVSDFTGPAFMGWLNANDIGGLNRNSYLGIFATFWRWCERMGYVSGRNPADAVSPASVDQDL
ncbi:MAG: hypothetical protein GY851_03785, partial [bacterium]|nr:hypothetical protein [bacterium]